MNIDLLDIYSDYLICSFGATTADMWKLIKPIARQIQSDEAVLIIDDCISEKPYTDESELVCWHFDHTESRNVKGINMLTALYHSKEVSLPVAFELIKKTELVTDEKTGKQRRKSLKTKNEYYREMLSTCVNNELPFRYVLNDIWFSSAENMRFVKETIKRDFIMPLKGNRKVALSRKDKQMGKYVSLSSLSPEEDTTLPAWLEGVDFELILTKQVFTNGLYEKVCG